MVLDKVQLIIAGLLFILFTSLMFFTWGLDNLTEESNMREVFNDEAVFQAVYFIDYGCTFLQCITEEDTQQVLFSAQANGFASRTKWFLILGVLILGTLIAVLSHKRKLAVRNIGIASLVVGLWSFAPLFLPTYDTIFGENIKIDLVYDLFFSPIQIPLIILLAGGIGLLAWSVMLHVSEKRTHKNPEDKKKK